MKQIVILSGKGGTGKTSVTAAFAHLAVTNGEPCGMSVDGSTRTVLVDADVDASNLELVLSPQVLETHAFQGGQVAVIEPALCEECGACAELCRFDAISAEGGIYTVDPIACEGCADQGPVRELQDGEFVPFAGSANNILCSGFSPFPAVLVAHTQRVVQGDNVGAGGPSRHGGG